MFWSSDPPSPVDDPIISAVAADQVVAARRHPYVGGLQVFGEVRVQPAQQIVSRSSDRDAAVHRQRGDPRQRDGPRRGGAQLGHDHDQRAAAYALARPAQSPAEQHEQRRDRAQRAQRERHAAGDREIGLEDHHGAGDAGS